MKKFALLGKNIGYSLSPKIHGLIFDYFKLQNHSYEILDIEHLKLAKNFSSLAKSYDGFNVTIPYKYEVKSLVASSASLIMPINTIVSKNGETVGYNTDFEGFRYDFLQRIILGKNVENAEYNDNFASFRYQLKKCLNLDKDDINAEYYVSFDLSSRTDTLSNNVENSEYFDKNANILIIGAGGAAEAVLYALKTLGLTATIKARNINKLEPLKKTYNASIFNDDFSPKLIINASGKNLIADGLLNGIDTKNLSVVYDISYNYSHIKNHFNKQNIAYFDGLNMLIYQAIFASPLLYSVDIFAKVNDLFNHIKTNLTT